MRGLVLCALSCSAGLVAGEIVSPGLGKCLDARLEQKEDAGIKRRETRAELMWRADRDAINVQLYACHEGFNQDFKMLTNGQIQLVGPNAAGKVLCLEAEHLTDSVNNNVRLTRCATQGGKEVVATALEKGTKYKITTVGNTLAAGWTRVGAGSAPAPTTEFTASKDASTGKAYPTWAEVTATDLKAGTWYKIISPTDGVGGGVTTFEDVGAADSNPGTVFVASGAGTNTGIAVAISDEVAATALVQGTPYRISSTGDTDWTLVGAAAAAVFGDRFTATGTAEAISDANFEKQVWILTGMGQLMIGTKCLDVKAAKTADGGREVWSEIKLHEKVNVQLYTCHNPEKTERVNQLWAWQPESFFSTDNWYTD